MTAKFHPERIEGSSSINIEKYKFLDKKNEINLGKNHELHEYTNFTNYLFINIHGIR
jgi:hypothetical protein